MNSIARLVLAVVALWLLCVIGGWIFHFLLTLTFMLLRVSLGLLFVVAVVGVLVWLGRQLRGV